MGKICAQIRERQKPRLRATPPILAFPHKGGEGICRSRFMLDFGWRAWLVSGFPLSRE